MAFAKERKKPDGSIYYEIRAYNKEKKHYYTKYYYPPDGWSARSVKKQLQRPEKRQLQQKPRSRGKNRMLSLWAKQMVT